MGEVGLVNWVDLALAMAALVDLITQVWGAERG